MCSSTIQFMKKSCLSLYVPTRSGTVTWWVFLYHSNRPPHIRALSHIVGPIMVATALARILVLIQLPDLVYPQCQEYSSRYTFLALYRTKHLCNCCCHDAHPTSCPAFTYCYHHCFYSCNSDQPLLIRHARQLYI